MKKTIIFITLFILAFTSLSAEPKVKKISSKQAFQYLSDENYLFVDTRSVDEYIGWPVNIEAEGHIKGAVDFPITWFSMLHGRKLEQELIRRGITKNKTLILYNNFGEEIKTPLTRMGYEVQILKDGIKEWNNLKYPIERLNGYQTYVYPQWIDDLIDGKKVANYDGRKYVILEVSYRQKPKGQIKNSIHIDDSLNHLRGERNFFKYKNIPLEVKQKFWNRPNDDKIEEILLSKGITKDTMVILYGPNLLAANRCAAVMKYAGVEDIRILNGGTKRLEKENYPFVKGYIKPVPVSEFGAEIPVNKDVLIDFDKELDLVNSPTAVIASIRSWPEYIGKVTGYTYINVKGDIANSRFGYAGSDPYHMQDYRNIDNTMFNYNIMKKRWEKWGITSDKEVSFHCGTGWRASETYFYARAMGWKNIHVYDGGWYEWHMRKDAPRKTAGIPKDAPLSKL